MNSDVILWLDLAGTAVFAATGAIKGVRHRLDLFGIIVLACCVGVGGGIIRDMILGAVPAAALKNG
ncbi:MAG: TRIC cation channel family protein, partial [Lentisphaeria bacterium]|nr:TRIC cation channel family protein [Lentisphaeria bacterium]